MRLVAALVSAVALFGSSAVVASAQARDRSTTAPQVRQDYVGQAYEQFLLARHFEAAEKTDEAIAAYKRAMNLDPSAADVPAELAALYLRENRAQEAVATAEQALKIDPDNREAHRVLGLVYAALSDGSRRGRAPGRAAQPPDENVPKAIDHLERALAGAAVSADPNVRATLARLYIRASAFEKAIPLLNELVNEEPGWDDGPGLLAEAYAGAGRDDDAIHWLEQAAPADPQLYATLADFYERRHRWKDAAGAYAKVIEVAPKSVELKTRYASALLNAGGRESAAQAREVLNELVAARPNEPRTLYLLSQAERRLGDAAAAETTARRIITQNSRSPWGYYALAEALEERRQYKAVVETLAPAVVDFRARGSDDPLGLTLLLPHLGFAYQQLGEYDKAIATFEDARKLSPDDETVSTYLIGAHLAARRYAQAADLARAARQEHPADLRLARLEAQALQKSGKAAEGAAILQEIVKQHADDPTAYVALAQFYVTADRAADAVPLLDEAEKKFPDSTEIPFELGAVYDKMKRFGDAEAQLRKVIAHEPENATALNYLGYMLADRGERLDEAVQLLTRALKAEPDNGSYLDSLGWAYFKSDKLDLAEQNLRRAAEQLTTNSVVQAHYGDVLFKLRRYSDAIAAWTRALSGDGEDVNPKDLNAKIKTAREKLGKR